MRVHTNTPNVNLPADPFARTLGDGRGLTDADAARARQAPQRPAQRTGLDAGSLVLYSAPLGATVIAFIGVGLSAMTHGHWHPPWLAVASIVLLPVALLALGFWQCRCCQLSPEQRNRWQRYAANGWHTIDYNNFSKAAARAQVALGCAAMMLMSWTLIQVGLFTTVTQPAQLDVVAQKLAQATTTKSRTRGQADAHDRALLRTVAPAISRAQERYYARSGRYATNLTTLRRFDPRAAATAAVTMTALDGRAPGQGWVLRAGEQTLMHARSMKPGENLYPHDAPVGVTSRAGDQAAALRHALDG